MAGWVPLAVRMALAAHLRMLVLLLAVLLTVALTIDYAESFGDLVRVAFERDLPLGGVTARYTLYRVIDMLTRLMPVAVLLSAFLTEILRRTRQETVILAAAGASVRPTVTALVGLGLGLGMLQGALETRLRPWAVFAQVDLGAGAYARRFAPHASDAPQWFVLGDQAVQATVISGARPELRDLRLFRGLSDAGFDDLILSERAVPLGRNGAWVLTRPVVWRTEGRALLRLPDRPLAETYALDLPAARVAYHGVAGFYLPDAPLRALIERVPDGDLGTALARRQAAPVLPGVFLLLGAALALTGFAGRMTRIVRLGAAALTGYAATVALKAFWALGEFGTVAPAVAVWTPLAGALGLAVLLLARLSLTGPPRH